MKRTHLWLSTLLALSVSVPAHAGTDDVELTSEIDRTSYALGYQIGGDFQRQRLDVNEEALVRGMEDAMNGASALMSLEAMHSTLIELKRKVVNPERSMPQLVRSSARGTSLSDLHEAVSTMPHARRPAARASEGAAQFFEWNAHQDGVVTMPSGVQYRVVRDGDGKKPRETDDVALIYRGALVNGNEFGNTIQNGKPVPRTFALASLVPGMREAVSHMREGAKWQVFVPPQLGFDASTPLYRKVTIFNIELVSVNP